MACFCFAYVYLLSVFWSPAHELALLLIKKKKCFRFCIATEELGRRERKQSSSSAIVGLRLGSWLSVSTLGFVPNKTLTFDKSARKMKVFKKSEERGVPLALHKEDSDAKIDGSEVGCVYVLVFGMQTYREIDCKAFPIIRFCYWKKYCLSTHF